MPETKQNPADRSKLVEALVAEGWTMVWRGEVTTGKVDVMIGPEGAVWLTGHTRGREHEYHHPPIAKFDKEAPNTVVLAAARAARATDA